MIKKVSSFLDAFSHLYKRVCPSVRRSIHLSIRPSIYHTKVETKQKCRFWPKLLSVRTRTHLMPCIRPCFSRFFLLHTHFYKFISILAISSIFVIRILFFFSQNLDKHHPLLLTTARVGLEPSDRPPHHLKLRSSRNRRTKKLIQWASKVQ